MATNNLRQIILTEGITQADLARKANLNTTTINRYCRGKRTPSPTTMHKIVNAINGISNKDYTVPDVFPSYSVNI